MKMVFALGMSRPLSMIVVATSTSASRRTKAHHRLLQLVLVHLAVADHDARLRHDLLNCGPRISWMFCTRLWTK